MISIIVAVSENGVIGNKGNIPWKLSADMRYFKEKTMGHTVVMGRKTHESIIKKIGIPLRDRRSIVLSKTLENDPRIVVARSFQEVKEIISKEKEEVFIIGGEEIYKLFLPIADRVYQTLVCNHFKGDAFFSIIRGGFQWRMVSIENHRCDFKNNPFDYNFYVFERVFKPAVNIDSARTDVYRRVLERIIADGKCPFCPENFRQYHTEEILEEDGDWFITPNAYSYKEAALALLLIPRTHKEDFEELTAFDFTSITKLINYAKAEFEIKGGGFAMRFGDPLFTGASVRHLHAHLIVPKIKDGKADPVVYFPFG